MSQILSSFTTEDCKVQEKFFSEISDAYLNRTLMRIRSKTGAVKYYRVCEIEFYLDHAEHHDTFTHGDSMQKQNCKWYFHKMNGAYKAGTYKGLDLSFGKPDINAIGGILLRSLREALVTEADGKLKVTGSGEFIEGPCNCVNRILKDTCSGENVKDLVGLDEFSLDAFNTKSNFHLVDENVVMESREIIKMPRVGLSLKKMDEQKPKYWLADYRHLTYPDLNKKMKEFIVLSMLDKGATAAHIATKTGTKVSRIDLLKSEFEKGKAKESTMVKEAKEGMKGEDWAQAYGLHTVLNRKN